VQTQRDLLPATQTDTPPRHAGARRPVVERIASWSARHRKTAVIGWLLLVAVAILIGNMLGTRNLNSYDPGEAGRAERVLDRPGVIQRPSETVLIQARAGGQSVARDPEVRQAVAQVTGALHAMPKVAMDVRSPLAPGQTALGAD
jgi:RND superfamily putative drug exporter